MTTVATAPLTESEQRVFQAGFWGLSPDATWDQIDEQARKEERAPLFYDHEDWRETMTRLYGPIFDR